MPIQSSMRPLLAGRRSALAINDLIESMRAKTPQVAAAFTSVQAAVNSIEATLRNNSTALEEFAVTDPNGKVICQIGTFVFGNFSYSGLATANLWVGPNADPSTAPFFCDGSNVVIGRNGVVYVQDGGGNTGATLGVTTETAKVITAATNASPSVITITGHGYLDGDTVNIIGATGNTAINGYRIVKYIDANTFSLTTLAGVAVNGNGALTNTPVCQRYYAGVLAQTFAIGSAFDTYKLRAFANGDLKIKDADISLAGTLSTIELNPTTGSIIVSQAGVTPFRRTTIAAGTVTLDWSSGSSLTTTISQGEATFGWGAPNNYGDSLSLGLTSKRATTTDPLSDMLVLEGYSGASAFGPRLALHHARGTGETPTNTVSGDQIGGVVGYGTDSVSLESSYVAALRFLATENHSAVTSHGTKLVLSMTPTGTAVVVDAFTLEDSGTGTSASLAADDSYISALLFKGGTTEQARIYRPASTTNQLRFSTKDYADTLCIKDGKVGVLQSSPAYALDVTGNVNLTGTPYINGTPGVDKTDTRLTGVSQTTTVLQYKDWAGANQSITVVTNFGSSSATDTFTKGIRTA